MWSVRHRFMVTFFTFIAIISLFFRFGVVPKQKTLQNSTTIVVHWDEPIKENTSVCHSSQFLWQFLTQPHSPANIGGHHSNPFFIIPPHKKGTLSQKLRVEIDTPGVKITVVLRSPKTWCPELRSSEFPASTGLWKKIAVQPLGFSRLKNDLSINSFCFANTWSCQYRKKYYEKAFGYQRPKWSNSPPKN